jgi:hypothetical protein
MERNIGFSICHPRYIEAKAQELVSVLVGKDSYPHGRAENMARIIYEVARSKPKHRRTVALIIRSILKDLHWQNVELQKDLLEELVYLATSKFTMSWTVCFISPSYSGC